jgi:hypothetical protein
MIATQKHRNVMSHLPGEKVQMGIAAAAVQHIMDQLSDLYSDRPYALVREYSTNALDSHVAAGQTRPIEVELPGPLEPTLVIRDFGVGMSINDVRDIYSQYGASTKRDSNDFNGTLGFGCKAAFAYTDTFVVKATQNGVRMIVSVSRDEKGTGEMTQVDTRTTDEPNGVEVRITVNPSEAHLFVQAAEHMFRFWPKGSVLVNGQEPKPFEGIPVTDSIYITPGDESYIVMAGVPYPCDRLSAYNLGLSYGHSIVAFVETGAVNFVPSREALKYTSVTDATVKQIERDFRTNVQAAVQTHIGKAKDRADAMERMIKWSSALRSITTSTVFTFNGEVIPWTLPIPGDAVPGSTHVLSRSSWQQQAPAAAIAKAYFVHGYDKASFTASHRRKLDMWAADKGLTPNSTKGCFWYLTKDKPDSKWIDQARLVKWDDVNAFKLPRAASSGAGLTRKSISGSYPVYDQDNTTYYMERKASDIDSTQPVLYVEGNGHAGRRYVECLADNYDKFTLVCLAANRVAKFQRDFPQAEKAYDAIDRLYQAWVKTVKAEDLRLFAMRQAYGCNKLTTLKGYQIDDPEVAGWVSAMTVDLTTLTEKRNLFYRVLGKQTPLPPVPAFDWSKYPLLGGMYGSFADAAHAVIYINAVYNKEA